MQLKINFKNGTSIAIDSLNAADLARAFDYFIKNPAPQNRAALIRYNENGGANNKEFHVDLDTISSIQY